MDNGTSQRSFELGPYTRVHLSTASVQGQSRGYAAIIGNTVPGDQFWMGWTTNGGGSWLQCGPFTVNSYGQAMTTPAMRTDNSPNWRFRACGSRGGGVTCTPWW
jgi:hypothetical protein